MVKDGNYKVNEKVGYMDKGGNYKITDFLEVSEGHQGITISAGMPQCGADRGHLVLLRGLGETAARSAALRARFRGRFAGVSGQRGWQAAMAACAGSCQTFADLGSALRAGAECSPSRVAAAVLTGAHAFGATPGLRDGGVLPLAPAAAEAFFARMAEVSGLPYGPGFVDWAVAIIHVINFLFLCRVVAKADRRAPLFGGQRRPEKGLGAHCRERQVQF